MAGFVVNDKNEVLLVQEKWLHNLQVSHWKLPGGHSEPGQTSCDPAAASADLHVNHFSSTLFFSYLSQTVCLKSTSLPTPPTHLLHVHSHPLFTTAVLFPLLLAQVKISGRLQSVRLWKRLASKQSLSLCSASVTCMATGGASTISTLLVSSAH